MNPPAVDLMRRFGLEPDDWQLNVLDSKHRRLLLNCCRQAGKSTVVAVLALATAMDGPFQKVLIVAPSKRQSSELFRMVTAFYDRFKRKMHKRMNASELLLGNDSRIICLPCNEHTIRGFSGVNLLILDEASRIPEDVYRAVRPSLIAARGRLVCLSTPYGKRGFFYKAWTSADQDWQRIEIPANMIKRLLDEDLEQERRALGEQGYRQEYQCAFEVVKGLVYPDIANCIVAADSPFPASGEGSDVSALPSPISGEEPGVSALPSPLSGEAPGVPGPNMLPSPLGGEGLGVRGLHLIKRKFGGIDFGYRNPFAAIWGHTDPDGVLWITHEHYEREQTIDWHADRLPRDVMFICDPHSPENREMLIRSNIKAWKGNASKRAGIDAVQSRIRNGGLRILEGACPNLIHEAGLYRWDDVHDVDEDKHPEEPLDKNNHALDALRYLVMHLKEHAPRWTPSGSNDPNEPPKPPRKKSIWQKLNEHTGWTYLT